MRTGHPAVRRSGRPLVMLAAAVVAGSACSRTDDAAPPGSSTPIIASGTTGPGGGTPPPPLPAAPGAPVEGSEGVLTTAPATLPPALEGTAAIAGGDLQEAACIDRALAVQAQRQPDLSLHHEAQAEAAGAAAVACLPPAKLAAALTERVAPADLTPTEQACVRALLVDGADRLDLVRFVGGLALGDVDVARTGAAAVDAACGTRLA
jgi:hypothetical protein